MMKDDDFDKKFKQGAVLTTIMVILMMLTIFAVAWTGIYLAVHNWG